MTTSTRQLGVLLASFAFLLSGVIPHAAGEERKNIVLIAGMKSHGPEGNGIHDYAWSVRLLKTMFERSDIRDMINIHVHFNGWPGDSQALADADTVVIISDGRDGDSGREAPHLATPERVALVESLVQKGCGIVTFHFSTFAPDALAEDALDWYGGYFDWESDGRRQWYSNIKTITAEVRPAVRRHAVLNGTRPFTMNEEFYYDIRFRQNDAGWIPIWTVEALPATKPSGNVVAWAVERDNGHRGFATTCGHFYENWRHEDFRKTILNAIAWTAHVPVPPEGVESGFFSRPQIAGHLAEPELVDSSEADEKTYPDAPYWYQPGHPIHPAEAAAIQTLPGFTVEKILTVPERLGSWTAITVDPGGRLICAAQHEKGLYRVTPPPLDAPKSEAKVESLQGAARHVGWSHGLLYAHGGLYVTVSEGNEEVGGGVYRLRDTDNDDQYDDVRQLLQLNPAGEHGPHNIVAGPDGQSLYLICGNGTKLPANVIRCYPPATGGIDHLMPPGFTSSKYTPQGFVLRFDRDGQDLEFLCGGLRNCFDLAFNHAGDLFTFDSDMEWDLGTSWYRPTRICHLVAGGEFGWRGDAAMWPEYYEDSVAPVINVGPASPTGLVFGYGANFPHRYQQALYACDWTFGTIHAIHLEPYGASYRATIEEFVAGRGLPVTDLVIGADGAMYFLVGGRRLGSALYRVRYDGQQADAISPGPVGARFDEDLSGLRRRLEVFHGIEDDQAVTTAWPFLGHGDRAIRFAARVAIESQPVRKWRDRALGETDPNTKIIAILALARKDTPRRQRPVIARLNSIDASTLPADQLLALLRAYELALARGEDEVAPERESVKQKLRPLFPHADRRVNRELVRLLCYLKDTSMIDPLLERMAGDTGEQPELRSAYFLRNQKYGEAIQDILEAAPLVERMHDAQMLLWIDRGWTYDERAEYFRLIADAVANSKGGHWYAEVWERIYNVAMEQTPSDGREQFASIAVSSGITWDAENLPQPKGPGRSWRLNELLETVQNNLHHRDFANGQKMFSAATCVLCHRFNTEGGSIGPDLSSLGQRFTIRDILDATLNPSKAVSDPYRLSVIVTKTGRTLTGRVVSQNAETLSIATSLRRPSQITIVDVRDIEEQCTVPVSTMPTELLDPLSEDEVLDLVAYLISGGDEEHPVFGE